MVKTFYLTPKTSILILSFCALVSATVLGDLAAQLKPGEWKELKTVGYNKKLLDPVRTDPENRNILTWTDEAFWDHTRNHLYFLGAAHGQPIAQFLDYEDSTNTWSLIPVPAVNKNEPVEFGVIRKGPTAVEAGEFHQV